MDKYSEKEDKIIFSKIEEIAKILKRNLRVKRSFCFAGFSGFPDSYRDFCYFFTCPPLADQEKSKFTYFSSFKAYRKFIDDASWPTTKVKSS